MLKYFHQLSESAQETVIERLRNNPPEFAWHAEYHDSLQAFCSEFGVRVLDFDLDHLAYATDAGSSNFRGRKLREFDPDYMPTGFTGDYPLWSTFHQEFKRTGDAKHAFDHALFEFFKEWRNDMEYSYSDEGLREYAELDQYEECEACGTLK